MVPEELKDKTVCVVGLGDVGQPLAEAFSKHLNTIGFDIDQGKIDRINAGCEGRLQCTTDPSTINQADLQLICVPTPVTKHKEPDLHPVRAAAEVVGKNLSQAVLFGDGFMQRMYNGWAEDLRLRKEELFFFKSRDKLISTNSRLLYYRD